MRVHFTYQGIELSVRVDTTNANFARHEIEQRYPGCVVGLILAVTR